MGRGATTRSTPGSNSPSAQTRASSRLLDPDFHGITGNTIDGQAERLSARRRILGDLHIHLIQPAAKERSEAAEHHDRGNLANQSLRLRQGKRESRTVL